MLELSWTVWLRAFHRRELACIVLLAFVGSAERAGALVTRTCSVRYHKYLTWSDEHFMAVRFLTGQELNTATTTFNYEPLSVYGAIWFAEGEVALVKLNRAMIGVGSTFDDSDFQSNFGILSYVDGIDQQGKKWRLETKKGPKFIDDLSPLQRRLYGIAEESGTQSTSPSGDDAVVVLKESGSDYFIVRSAKGYAVLEWYGGNDPEVGDVIRGIVDKYGMRRVMVPGKRQTRVWVQEFGLSKERAVEIYVDQAK